MPNFLHFIKSFMYLPCTHLPLQLKQVLKLYPPLQVLHRRPHLHLMQAFIHPIQFQVHMSRRDISTKLHLHQLLKPLSKLFWHFNQLYILSYFLFSNQLHLHLHRKLFLIQQLMPTLWSQVKFRNNWKFLFM